MKRHYKSDIILYIFCTLLCYIGFSLIFNLSLFMTRKLKLTFGSILYVAFHNSNFTPSCILALLVGLLITVLITDQYSLDVKLKRAGNGQYGDARFLDTDEKAKTYPKVAFGHEKKPGIVVEYDSRAYRVDCSDQSMLLCSPPGGGKTTRVFVPSIYYNAQVNRRTHGQGASMLITDVKGQLEKICKGFLIECGYNCYTLNFRYPLYSYHCNLMNTVNKYIDLEKMAKDNESKISAQARAEKYAKQLAEALIKNAGISMSNVSESSEYFNETSQGLLTAIIILVSKYGIDGERHIISVFRLIVELNGITEDSTDTLQKNRLEQLFELLPEENREKLFAGPSTKADVRTSMNIFSSALGKLLKLLDAELEQLICDHSPEIEAENFIEKPTAIFIILPDEDTTKHFFGSLFIRSMMNELIKIAEIDPNQTLSRTVLCYWDEFGQIPAIQDFSTLISAVRSRGIRFLLSLQALAQLEDKYSPAQVKNIKDCIQMTMFSYQSPLASDTTKAFSTALGGYTTMSGSVSHGQKNDSQSIQLIGTQLMTGDKIIHMPPGKFVLLKAGSAHPAQVELPSYYDIFNFDQSEIKPSAVGVKKIEYLTEEKIKKRAGSVCNIVPGQFDCENYDSDYE